LERPADRTCYLRPASRKCFFHLASPAAALQDAPLFIFELVGAKEAVAALSLTLDGGARKNEAIALVGYCLPECNLALTGGAEWLPDLKKQIIHDRRPMHP
jgi:hypothetical protein